MRFLRQMLTIAAKDLRSELRTKEAVNASLSFALVILLLFSFAFDPTSDMTREIGPAAVARFCLRRGARSESQFRARVEQRLP